MPFDQGVFSYPDCAVLVRLISSKLLINPRMRVSAEPQTSLRFPLFDGTNQALNAILASINKVFLVLDNLADLPNKSIIVADHSI